MVVIHVFCKGLCYESLLQDWNFHHPVNLFVRGRKKKSWGRPIKPPLPSTTVSQQALPCRDWNYYISCYTIKDMTRKGKKLATTDFCKLQLLKPIILFNILVIERIFVWVFLYHICLMALTLTMLVSVRRLESFLWLVSKYLLCTACLHIPRY